MWQKYKIKSCWYLELCFPKSSAVSVAAITADLHGSVNPPSDGALRLDNGVVDNEDKACEPFHIHARGGNIEAEQ